MLQKRAEKELTAFFNRLDLKPNQALVLISSNLAGKQAVEALASPLPTQRTFLGLQLDWAQYHKPVRPAPPSLDF